MSYYTISARCSSSPISIKIKISQFIKLEEKGEVQEGTVAFQVIISISIALFIIIQVYQYGMNLKNCSYRPSNGNDFQIYDSHFFVAIFANLWYNY